MDSMMAFAMGEANRGKPLMVFDWNKAARVIKERGATSASAGLSGDWGNTGGEILTDGKPNTTDYTYLASTWATPELNIDGETIDCFIMEDDVPADWGDTFSDIKWPLSAIEILNAQ